MPVLTSKIVVRIKAAEPIATVKKSKVHCSSLWHEVLVADEEVERLCTDSEGEYLYDTIAMTVDCINTLSISPDDTKQYEDHPIWRACLSLAKGHLAFRAYMRELLHH